MTPGGEYVCLQNMFKQILDGCHVPGVIYYTKKEDI